MKLSLNHALDNPVWHALVGPHQAFATRRGLALHYPREVAAFSAIAEDTVQAYADLAQDLPADLEARLLRRSFEPSPDDWVQVKHLPLLQMVASESDGRVLDGPAFTTLGRDDIGAVAALIDLTNPGPFGTRTLEMGRYVGVLEEGQLVALAGERLRLTNYVELSAICTHPLARGRGLAGHLVRCLMRDAFARGQTPFLHVLPENTAAISLYRKLGFAVRTDIHYLWRKPIRLGTDPDSARHPGRIE